MAYRIEELAPEAFESLFGMMDGADAKIRALFDDPRIDTIHAHSAAYGCFLARIERN